MAGMFDLHFEQERLDERRIAQARETELCTVRIITTMTCALYPLYE